MTDQTDASFYLPSKMGRTILMALEEVIGRNGVNAILNQADLSNFIENYPPDTLDRQFPYEALSAIHFALEQIFGSRGGRGVALRSGRVCLKYGLREFNPAVHLKDADFRLASMDTKVQKGLQLFAQFFNQYTDQCVSVENNSEAILWKIERCPVCWGRHSDAPVCHMMVGALQEGMYWISGGKFYNVEEISCTAKGDRICTIRIDKQMIE